MIPYCTMKTFTAPSLRGVAHTVSTVHTLHLHTTLHMHISHLGDRISAPRRPPPQPVTASAPHDLMLTRRCSQHTPSAPISQAQQGHRPPTTHAPPHVDVPLYRRLAAPPPHTSAGCGAGRDGWVRSSTVQSEARPDPTPMHADACTRAACTRAACTRPHVAKHTAACS